MNFRLRPLSYAVIVAIGLGGCITKGDSDALDNDILVQLTGTVAKGIVIGGTVTAYAVTNGQIDKTRVLGSQETNELGQYAITITNYSGPVALHLTPTLVSAKTKCDVPTGCAQNSEAYAFGQPMPLNFGMDAIVPYVSEGAVSASITPLTHMAAFYAQHSGLDAASANKRVARLFGLTDILTTKPVDITRDEALGSAATSLDSIKYGYFAAAIAKIAQEDYAGDISLALARLATSYANGGGELANNEATDSTTVVTFTELMAAAYATIAAETGITGGVFALAKDDVTTLHSLATAATTGSTTTTNPETPIGNTDVAAAKAVVTELRTWARTLNQEFEDQLNPNYVPAAGSNAISANFAQKVETALYLGTDDLSNLAKGLSIAIEAASEIYYRIKLGELSDGTHSIASAGYQATGDVVIAGTSISVSNALIGGTTVSFNAVAPAETGTEFKIEINSASAENAGAKLVVAAGSLATLTLEDSLSNIYSGASSTVYPRKLDFALEATLQQKKTTRITDPIAFAGKTVCVMHFKNVVDLFGIGGSYKFPFPTPESIVSSGTFSTSTGDKITGESTLHVANAATFDPFSTKSLPEIGSIWADAGSYAFSPAGNELNVSLADGGGRVYTFNNATKRVSASYRYGDGYQYNRQFMGNPEYTSLQNFLDTDYYTDTDWVWVENRGNYTVEMPSAWNSAGGKLPGTLQTQDKSYETANNWADVDSSFTYTTQFAGLPEAKVTLSADRTGWNSLQGRATVSYRNVTMALTADYDPARPTSEPNFTSALIVDVAGKGRLELYPDSNSDTINGSVKVDSKVVGNIVGSLKGHYGISWIVNYSNGDFESLAF